MVAAMAHGARARPVRSYERARIGRGRLRSQEFEGADGPCGLRESAKCGSRSRRKSFFFHYANRVGLASAPFPNPLTRAAGQNSIESRAQTFTGGSSRDLPPQFSEGTRGHGMGGPEENRLQSSTGGGSEARDVRQDQSAYGSASAVWDGSTV